MDFTHFWWVMKPQNFHIFFSLMQQNRKIKFNFKNNPVINFTSYIMFYRLFYFTIQFIFILLYFEENLSINQFELCFLFPGCIPSGLPICWSLPQLVTFLIANEDRWSRPVSISARNYCFANTNTHWIAVSYKTAHTDAKKWIKKKYFYKKNKITILCPWSDIICVYRWLAQFWWHIFCAKMAQKMKCKVNRNGLSVLSDSSISCDTFGQK